MAYKITLSITGVTSTPMSAIGECKIEETVSGKWVRFSSGGVLSSCFPALFYGDGKLIYPSYVNSDGEFISPGTSIMGTSFYKVISGSDSTCTTSTGVTSTNGTDEFSFSLVDGVLTVVTANVGGSAFFSDLVGKKFNASGIELEEVNDDGTLVYYSLPETVLNEVSSGPLPSEGEEVEPYPERLKFTLTVTDGVSNLSYRLPANNLKWKLSTGKWYPLNGVLPEDKFVGPNTQSVLQYHRLCDSTMNMAMAKNIDNTIIIGDKEGCIRIDTDYSLEIKSEVLEGICNKTNGSDIVIYFTAVDVNNDATNPRILLTITGASLYISPKTKNEERIVSCDWYQITKDGVVVSNVDGGMGFPMWYPSKAPISGNANLIQQRDFKTKLPEALLEDIRFLHRAVGTKYVMNEEAVSDDVKENTYTPHILSGYADTNTYDLSYCGYAVDGWEGEKEKLRLRIKLNHTSENPNFSTIYSGDKFKNNNSTISGFSWELSTADSVLCSFGNIKVKYSYLASTSSKTAYEKYFDESKSFGTNAGCLNVPTYDLTGDNIGMVALIDSEGGDNTIAFSVQEDNNGKMVLEITKFRLYRPKYSSVTITEKGKFTINNNQTKTIAEMTVADWLELGVDLEYKYDIIFASNAIGTKFLMNSVPDGVNILKNEYTKSSYSDSTTFLYDLDYDAYEYDETEITTTPYSTPSITKLTNIGVTTGCLRVYGECSYTSGDQPTIYCTLDTGTEQTATWGDGNSFYIDYRTIKLDDEEDHTIKVQARGTDTSRDSEIVTGTLFYPDITWYNDVYDGNPHNIIKSGADEYTVSCTFNGSPVSDEITDVGTYHYNVLLSKTDYIDTELLSLCTITAKTVTKQALTITHCEKVYDGNGFNTGNVRYKFDGLKAEDIGLFDDVGSSSTYPGYYYGYLDVYDGDGLIGDTKIIITITNGNSSGAGKHTLTCAFAFSDE